MVVKPPAGSLVLKSTAPRVRIVAAPFISYVEPLDWIWEAVEIAPAARDPPVYTANVTSDIRGPL